MAEGVVDQASRFLEGTLEPSEQERLAALLRDDPAARRTFARLLYQHAALRWLYGRPAEVRVERPAPSRRAWLRWAAVAALLLVALGLAWWQFSTIPPVATVLEADPDVVARREGAWLTVTKGFALRAGDELQTREAATARFRFASEPTTINLRGETQLRLGGKDPKQMELPAGTIEGQVAPQPEGQAVIVASPQAEVRVLGTVFRMASAPEETRVEVDRGRVRVKNRSDARTIEVPEGHIATAARGVEFRAVPRVEEITDSLRNGDFETGDLSGWTDRESQMRREISVAPEFAHGGRGGVRLVGHGGLDQKVRTAPGKTYYVGAWVRIQKVFKVPTWGGVRVAVYPEGEGTDRWTPMVWYPFITTGRELPKIWTIVEPGEWHRVRFSFVAQTVVTTLRCDHFTDGKLEFWADDFIVSPAPLPD